MDSPRSIALSHRSQAGVLLRRAAAAAIDSVLFFGLSLLLGAPAALSPNPSRASSFFLKMGMLVVVLGYFAYGAAAESTSGQTLGKCLLRIRVVDGYGNTPTTSQAARRALFRILEANPWLGYALLVVSLFFWSRAGLGYGPLQYILLVAAPLGGFALAGAVALVSPTNRRIGDYATDTFVLLDRDLHRLDGNLRLECSEPQAQGHPILTLVVGGTRALGHLARALVRLSRGEQSLVSVHGLPCVESRQCTLHLATGPQNEEIAPVSKGTRPPPLPLVMHPGDGMIMVTPPANAEEPSLGFTWSLTASAWRRRARALRVFCDNPAPVSLRCGEPGAGPDFVVLPADDSGGEPSDEGGVPAN
jgi:uncharacterized RDD family membrane protein YckC